ncbi:MAG TPA: hypothetical protein DCL61_06475 [Cyanobacteria bacterium UBA12227]|nr:hypothetical protein [Cyanobacteria bacterium UBA12227]HAX89881.1 hypothetical protein [Cyanobacteria bacterium UBA11370]HBY76043.1 hypothetical protein [Cyanobacteria bacterium UBA11148]
MTFLDLENAISHYTDGLTSLEEFIANQRTQKNLDTRIGTETILDVLIVRDRIQWLLAEESENPKVILLTLHELDQRLKRQGEAIAKLAPLAELRAILNPPLTAWWWFLDTVERLHPWDRYDWLWGALTVPVLTVNFSLVAAISARFLSGGVDTLGALTVVGQAVLALTAAGGTLTETGRHVIENILESFKIPKHFWHEVKLGTSLLVLLSLVGLQSSLPKIANFYVEEGKKDEVAGQPTSALADYRRATELDPNNMEAHFRLGSVYENLLDFEKARAQYRIAIFGGYVSAYSNLGRLYILEGKDYAAAAFLLKQGLLQAQDNSESYFLLKNLGWARLKQARYDEAEANLQQAIDLGGNQASAYCLLAQVKEAKGDKKGAIPSWQKCRDLVDGLNPDEDKWFDIAQQRLNSTSNQSTQGAKAKSGNP